MIGSDILIIFPSSFRGITLFGVIVSRLLSFEKPFLLCILKSAYCSEQKTIFASRPGITGHESSLASLCLIMRGGRVFTSFSAVVRLSAQSHVTPRRVLGSPSRNFAATTLPPDRLEFSGQFGTKYTVFKTLQEEKFPPRRVYLASDPQGEKTILKYIHEANYRYLVNEIYGRLRSNTHHLRLYKDVVPEMSLFVFEHFTGHLLELAQKGLPILTTKRILKEALLGLAEMHDQDIVHTGMFHQLYL